MILASACKFLINGNEVVLCGVRHGDIYNQLKLMGCSDSDFEEIEQGFVTHENIFLNRREALDYAMKCGQIPAKLLHGNCFNELVSEDLW